MTKWIRYLLICGAAFGIALIASWLEGARSLYASYDENGLWAFIVALWHYLIVFSPVFAAIGVGLCLARVVGALDELQQRIQLEALAFSLANTVLATLTLGLLSRFDLPNIAWTLPMAGVFYGIGLWMARRRYQ